MKGFCIKLYIFVGKQPMRFLIFISLFGLLLTSCSMDYETTLNKDGSGEENFEMDMNGIGQFAAMFEGASEDGELDEEKLGENIDKKIDQEALDEMLEADPQDGDFDLSKIFSDPSSLPQQDTSFTVFELMNDSLKGTPNAYLMKLVRIGMQSDSINDEMKISFNLKFKDQTERLKIREEMPNYLSDGKDRENNGSNMDMTKSMMGALEKIDLKKGLLIIPPMDLKSEDAAAGSLEEEDDETKAMMAMMFGSSGIRHTYHLPGKIEFTSDPKAKIDGNTVVFFTPLIDLIEAELIPQRIIKFNPN